MALRTTAITPVPLNLDGTLEQPTWGEAGGPYAAPAQISAGMVAETLGSNVINFNAWQPARVLRALMDRSVLSDEGLFTTCVVRQGAWNTGGGTLNITLEPTRLVIDVAQTGGTVLELYANLGDPEVLPALSDSYVDIKDDGTVTVVSVANADPEPTITVDSVRTYVLVTDGVQLDSATLKPEVAPFPCLGPTIGMSNAFIGELAVTGGVAADTLETTGTATLGGLQVDGNTALGEDSSNTLNVKATMDAPAGIRGAAATPLTLLEGATVTAAKPLTGTLAPAFDGYEVASETPSTGDRQIHHLGGEPRWRDGDDDYLHHGTEPWGPVGSVPSLAAFGPAIGEIDGPSVSVTLTGTAFLQVVASAVITGTDLSTVARIKVDIDGADVYNETFRVFNTDRALSWGTSFHFQKAAGTYTVKIQFSRDSGGGSVNLTSASIIVTPV